MSSYADFLASKRQLGGRHGFAPLWMPEFLFDFQASLVDWATWKGRAALFCDCGMGKTPMQLVWAQNVVMRTNRPVLIVAPLAASTQTVREAAKFGIACERSSTGQHTDDARIIVTNYERLHLFDASRYAGMVCDESSILKNFDGVTKSTVTEFMRLLPYRLLCTATAAPNDYIELGTSSEALGEMGHVDMLGRFFKNDESSLAPLAHGAKWRFKPHAERPFWQWMCGWARAARKPSDVGPFDDARLRLPALHERVVTIEASRPMPGHLFVTAARTLPEQREERRVTIKERCEAVAEAAHGTDSFVAWCHLNAEADMLVKMIPDSRQVSGADSDERKIELFDAFTTGQLTRLVTKPKIGAFGLNWQHCANLSAFPSHSYEQYYQMVRRCWRYGQDRDVTVHVITTQGEGNVLGNLQRKAAAADKMFAVMAEEMQHANHDSADTSDRPLQLVSR
jgi:hypothetical protein